MAEITREQLRTEINAILKDADFTKTSSKKVRLQLEEKLDCELLDRKKEIDGLVMDYVNSQHPDDSEEDESEDEKPVVKKSTSKKRKGSSDESDSDSHNTKKTATKAKKSKRGSSSDSDSGVSRKKKKKAAPKKAKGAPRGTGYTRPYQLSPQLAAVVGADSMPRHEVVKKVWAIIKERNLYDPKNKQFAICDTELQTVMGVKRFRTFGMLKYLKTHFID